MDVVRIVAKVGPSQCTWSKIFRATIMASAMGLFEVTELAIGRKGHVHQLGGVYTERREVTGGRLENWLGLGTELVTLLAFLLFLFFVFLAFRIYDHLILSRFPLVHTDSHPSLYFFHSVSVGSYSLPTFLEE